MSAISAELPQQLKTVNWLVWIRNSSRTPLSDSLLLQSHRHRGSAQTDGDSVDKDKDS